MLDPGLTLLARVAWQAGELSLGMVEVPPPADQNKSCRIRVDSPLRAELHWKAYGSNAELGAGDWEEEEEPLYMPPSPHGWGAWM